ncbi:hypothetical protein ACHAW5_007891 [Stephanodiscus triporus]|uniref:Uncharacterized protein n=1 Tax=Stephanodiscus triporus TaxID=2934178 RepID=A0ABD3Q5M2_9STRA
MKAYAAAYLAVEDGPVDFIHLRGALTITQRGLDLHGKWLANNDRQVPGHTLPSFQLTHNSKSNDCDKHTALLNGTFPFNGYFECNGRLVDENNVMIPSRRTISEFCPSMGWGQRRSGDAATGPTTYEVSLRKDYILEVGARLWKRRSVQGTRLPVDCVGEVQSFDVKRNQIRVWFYKDGKFEWISDEEALVMAGTHPPSRANDGLGPIDVGTITSRYFLMDNGKTQRFEGKVISRHAEKNKFTIEYEDGTKEILGEDVVRHVAVGNDTERLLALVSSFKPNLPIRSPPLPLSMSTIIARAPLEVIDLAGDDDLICPGEGSKVDHIPNDGACKTDLDSATRKLKSIRSEIAVKEKEMKVLFAQEELIIAKQQHAENVDRETMEPKTTEPKKGVNRSPIQEPPSSLSHDPKLKRIKIEPKKES